MALDAQKTGYSIDEEIPPRVIALSGGIGGAKLVLGLSNIIPDESLLAVANTGDDFEHLGLSISPDIDTLTYTLAGINNQEMGWGRAGETWTFMKALASLGGENWFNLGDGDLAIHIERTRRLAAGESLTSVTRTFAKRLGISVQILPMTDDPVRTIVQTEEGEMAFQHYFVRERCRPVVISFNFEGAESAHVNPEIIKALSDPALKAIVICPSNPFISIDPILSVPGMREALRKSAAPVLAVSPIVGGQSIKGPTAKMMIELGLPSAALSVAEHYKNVIDGFILDRVDEMYSEAVKGMGIAVQVSNTLMNSMEDRVQLAKEVLKFADGLPGKKEF
ncbi:MAG: 2-phospho-L-lactate transferase [SAR324 cluster bacterium]|nr:2-phospho-L-lactate transferase [SAR324 cluster bacterium]